MRESAHHASYKADDGFMLLKRVIKGLIQLLTSTLGKLKLYRRGIRNGLIFAIKKRLRAR